jgi:hypothetical protein
MQRLKLSAVQGTVSSGTNFSRREEKAADLVIAGNVVLAQMVEKQPELKGAIANAIIPMMEFTPGKTIEPGLRIPAQIFDPGPRIPIATFDPGIRFPLDPGIRFPTPIPQPPAPVPTPPVSQIDLEIQLLLNAIPIANQGNIITSEYHNSLRNALMAIAERMGLTIKPVSEMQLLTLAPKFLPTSQGDAHGAWVATFDKAALAPDANGVVKGSLAVQLPDGAVIISMTVRGARVGDEKDKPPKLFNVKLSRQKFDTEASQITPLITFKLADKKEKIKELNDIKGSLPEDLDDAPTVRSRVLDLSRVNNQAYQYFIEANWDGTKDTAKFEIYSIQILFQI